jgi:hypothetical protein
MKIVFLVGKTTASFAGAEPTPQSWRVKLKKKVLGGQN